MRQYLACRKPKLRGQLTTNVTVHQTSNDCVNKKVFKRCLKVATDDAVTKSVGRLFHSRGAAAPNARSPIVRSRMRKHQNISARVIFPSVHLSVSTLTEYDILLLNITLTHVQSNAAPSE